jgi:hypothetical protein
MVFMCIFSASRLQVSLKLATPRPIGAGSLWRIRPIIDKAMTRSSDQLDRPMAMPLPDSG